MQETRVLSLVVFNPWVREIPWSSCCCLVTKSCPTLWTHELQHTRLPCPSLSLEFAQTHIHWVGGAIDPSHSLSPTSLPAFNLSQHQSFLPMSWLFISGGQSIGASASASVLSMNIQGWFPLGLTDLILQSKGLSRVFPSTTSRKHQFFSAQPSSQSNSHIHT